MTVQRSATPHPLRRPPLLSLPLLLLLLLVAALPAFAATSVGIVNPQSADLVSAAIIPATYTINGVAFDADQVGVTIDGGSVIFVPVKRGAWEYIWDVSAFADASSHTIAAAGYKKGFLQTTTALNTLPLSVTIAIDKPTKPSGAVNLFPSLVDSALYLNTTTLGINLSVQYRAVPSAGKMLTAINYLDNNGLVLTTTLDGTTLNQNGPGANDLRASYVITDKPAVPLRTLTATFTDSAALTSNPVTRHILVDDAAPSASLSSAVNANVTMAGVPTPAFVLTGMAQDGNVANGNAVSGIADVKVVARRVKDSSGSPVSDNFLLIPAQLSYGTNVNSSVTWQAVLPPGTLIGTYDFDILATDNAGNRLTLLSSANSNQAGIVVNLSAPSAVLNTIKNAASAEVTGGIGRGTLTFNITAITATGNIASYQIFDTFQGTTTSATGGPIVPTPATGAIFNQDVSPTYNSASVPDGLHAYTLIVTDTQGNTNTTAPKNVTIDNTPPTGVFTAPAPNAFAAGTVTLTGTVSDNLLLKSYALTEGGVALPGMSSKTYTIADNKATDTFSYSLDTTGLSSGAHTFTLTVTDQAGNTPFTATLTLRVANTPPTITPTAPAPGAFVSNPVALSGTVNDPLGNGPVQWNVFDGLASVPAVLTLNGGLFPTPQTGNFTNVNLPVTLTPGTHTLVFVAESAAGVFSLNPQSTLTITVDDTAPNAPVLTAPAASAYLSGLLAPTVTISGTASETAAPAGNTLTTHVFVDGSEITPAPTGATFNVTWNLLTFPTSPNDGKHTISAYTVNASGKQSATAFRMVTVDNIAPSVSVICPANGATVAAGTPLLGVVSDANPSLNAASVHFNYSFGATTGTIPAALDATGRTASAVIPSLFAGHSVALSLTATDLAGNTSTSAPITITVPGSSNALNHVDAMALNPLDGSSATRQNSVTGAPIYVRGVFSVFGTISANNSPTYTVNLVNTADLANAAAVPALTIGTGSGAQSAALLGSANSASIPDGSYYLRLDITSGGPPTLGTVVAGTAVVVVVDNTAPVITSADVNGVNGAFFNNITSPKTLAGTATDVNIATTYVLVDNALYPNSAGTMGGSVSASTTGISEGVHTFRIIALDKAGNRTASNPADTFTVDNTNPLVAILSPQNNTSVTVGTPIIGAITDVNPSPNPVNVYFSYNGVRDNNPVTLDATSRTVTSTIPAFALSMAPAFITSVTLTAIDKAGNLGVSPILTLTITSPTTGLSDIDATVLNPADGSPLTRHNALPTSPNTNPTYIRGIFSVFGTVSGIVGATNAALQKWTVVLYDTTTSSIARTVGTGTTAQSAALLGTADTTGLTETDQYQLRLNLTDVNNTTTTGTVGAGTAAAVVVDNTPPAIVSADLNAVNGKYFNNAANPQILAGASSDANTGSTYLLLDNALYPNSAGTPGTGVLQSTSGISEGVHTFRIVAVDKAGNRTASDPADTFTIDNTNPVVVILSPQNNTSAAIGAQITGNISDVNPLTPLIAPGPPPDPTKVYFSYNGVRDANPVTLDATGRTVTSVIPASVSGTVSVTLTATDKAGNVSTSAPNSITISTVTTGLNRIDTTALNPVDGSPLTRQNLLPAPQTYVRGSFNVFGTVSGVINGATLKYWTLVLYDTTTNSAGQALLPVFGPTAGLSQLGTINTTGLTQATGHSETDQYLLRLDLTDVNGATTLGTVAAGTAAAVTVDNTAPVITSADVNGVNGAFFNNTTNSKTLAGTYTDLNPAAAYLLVDNTLYPNSAGTAGTSVSASTTGLIEGPHSFNIVAIDKAGNRTVSAPTSNFYIDNTLISITGLTVSPSLVATQSSSLTTAASAANGSALLIVGGNNLTVSATLSDNTDPRNSVKWAIELFQLGTNGTFTSVTQNGVPILQNDSLNVSGGNTAVGPVPVPFNNGQVSILSGLRTAALPNGRYVITVIAIDRAGNNTRSYLEIQVLNGGNSTATGLPGAALLAYAAPAANKQIAPPSVLGITPSLAQIDNRGPSFYTVFFRSDHLLTSLSDLKIPSVTGMFDQYGNPVARPDTNPNDNGTQTLYTGNAFILEASIFQSVNATLSEPTNPNPLDVIPSLSVGASNASNPPAGGGPVVNLDNSSAPFTYSLSRTVPAMYQFVLIAADAANKAAKPALINIVLDATAPLLNVSLPVAQQTYSPGDILVLDFTVAKISSPPAPIKRLPHTLSGTPTYSSAPSCVVWITPANAAAPQIGPPLNVVGSVGFTTSNGSALSNGYDLYTALNTPDLQSAGNYGAAVVTGDAFSSYRVRWQIRLFSQFYSAGTAYTLHIGGLTDVAGNAIAEKTVLFKVGS